MNNLNSSSPILIPSGICANDDAAAAQRRRELARMLNRGERITVNQRGEAQTSQERNSSSQDSIEVPPGKLAVSFYWYERDSQLLNAEVTAMKKFFPQFQLDKLPDGRLYWVGFVSTNNVRLGGRWALQSIYDNNHPHNNSYSGSIKIYTIEPDLDDLIQKLGGIPHVLRDTSGNAYLCTARHEDFRASVSHSTTAASALSFAVKWITVFELWLQGDVTTEAFSGHVF